MAVHFIITMLVLIAILFSLRYCRKSFEKFELICLFLFCSNMVQQMFYTVSSAYKIAEVKPAHLEFWIARMDCAGILPALLIWCFYTCRNIHARVLQVLVLLGWVGIYILDQKLRILTGVLVDHGWNPRDVFVWGSAIVCLCIAFMYFFRRIARKEGLI